ncbi:MAG: agmatinase family protein [Myxococcales bacterium]|nr:agmatinase family protein [Myxococcales bacterium]
MSFDPSAAARPGSGVFGLPTSVEDAGVILIPVPFDATTSYGSGAADGPRAILEASRQVDLFDLETGRPYQAGIVMLDESEEIRAWNAAAHAAAAKVIAAGGVIPCDLVLEAAAMRVDALCAAVNERVGAIAEDAIGRGRIVGTVGGDHATPLGAIAAHARAWPGLGVLHLDAHADLRHAYEGFSFSHASIMNHVAGLPGVSRIVQVGIRDLSEEEHQAIAESGGRIVTFFDAALQAERFAGATFASQLARIVDALPHDVYLSYDIDGLDPSLCPHTGTPVPGGLSFAEACALTAAVARSGRRIVGFDLCEVAPGPDGDGWDGNVGARLLYKMIGWTLKSR